jgi:type IV pilus assembly protein PilX
MRSHPVARKELRAAIRQRGVVLFFTLIALVVMSLAAVALIRSVDTSTMIAGNLAYKQSATTSGDGAIEAAMNWLTAQQNIMTSNGQSVYIDTTPPTLLFNTDNPALGYYSSVHPVTALTDGTLNWTTSSAFVGTDTSGNRIWYVIERMCNVANQIPSQGNCLFGSPVSTLGDQSVKSADQSCGGNLSCLQNAQSPQLRITARVAGAKNTYSFVQTFAY